MIAIPCKSMVKLDYFVVVNPLTVNDSSFTRQFISLQYAIEYANSQKKHNDVIIQVRIDNIVVDYAELKYGR